MPKRQLTPEQRARVTERQRERRAKDPGRNAAYARAAYKRDPAKALTVQRAYYARHKDRVKARVAAYYEAHEEERNRRAERSAEWKRAHPARVRDHWRKRYGLSFGEYDQLVEKQRNRCATCGSPPGKRRLCVDHDHETGKVRGLLCPNCNKALGFTKDRAEVLLALAAYLRGHAPK